MGLVVVCPSSLLVVGGRLLFGLCPLLFVGGRRCPFSLSVVVCLCCRLFFCWLSFGGAGLWIVFVGFCRVGLLEVVVVGGSRWFGCPRLLLLFWGAVGWVGCDECRGWCFWLCVGCFWRFGFPWFSGLWLSGSLLLSVVSCGRCRCGGCPSAAAVGRLSEVGGCGGWRCSGVVAFAGLVVV